MKRIFRRLTWLLMIAGMIVSLVVLAAPGPVQAATCTPQATLPADISPNGPLDTGGLSVVFARKDTMYQITTVELAAILCKHI